MRVIKVLYGEKTIVSQYVNNTSAFTEKFELINGRYSYQTFVSYMNTVCEIDKKKKYGIKIDNNEVAYSNEIKEQLFEFLRNNITMLSKSNPDIISELISELNDNNMTEKLHLSSRIMK